MKGLLIGANGQLGSDLVKALTSIDLIPLTHRDVDICEPVGLRETVKWWASQAHPSRIALSIALETPPEYPLVPSRYALHTVSAMTPEVVIAPVIILRQAWFCGSSGM